jgi:hydrogenase expression/formation protein HypC
LILSVPWLIIAVTWIILRNYKELPPLHPLAGGEGWGEGGFIFFTFSPFRLFPFFPWFQKGLSFLKPEKSVKQDFIMCLAIPMRLIEINGVAAVAEVDGVTRAVRLDLLPEAVLGDYVLIHAGLAIARVDAEHAEETLSLLRSLADEVY